MLKGGTEIFTPNRNVTTYRSVTVLVPVQYVNIFSDYSREI